MNLLALVTEKGSITTKEAIEACGGDEEEAVAQFLMLHAEHKIVLVHGGSFNMLMSTEAFGKMILEVSRASTGNF